MKPTGSQLRQTSHVPLHRRGAFPPSLRAPPIRQHTTIANGAELKVYAKNFPPACDTHQIYEILQDLGNVIKIDIAEPRRDDSTQAYVTFNPPPKTSHWIRQGLEIANDSRRGRVEFNVLTSRPMNRHPSLIDSTRTFAEETTVTANGLGFGVMKTESSMLEFAAVESTETLPIRVTINLWHKRLDVDFAMNLPSFPQHHVFKLCLNIAQIKSVVKMQNASGQIAMVVTTSLPPFLYRKTNNPGDTHEQGATYWNPWQTWYRQTGVERYPGAARHAFVQLEKQDTVIDLGRWLTYKLVFSPLVSGSKELEEICDAMYHYNVVVREDRAVSIEKSQAEDHWNWLDDSHAVSQKTAKSSALSELHKMAVHAIHLPFEVRYQLEACISNGRLHECNINEEFLTKLQQLGTAKAVRLLETLLDGKEERFFNADDIFRRFLPKTSIAQKETPPYCASLRSAIVTPSTVYFNSPALEVSNSIIRKYHLYTDRFIRVKFTDEKYKGKIMSSEDKRDNELFTRIKRAMTNGLNVGGRHYDFLACGNSQFREGGAYFFASSNSLTAQDIRNGMGDFSKIMEIPKYCARLGQAFSTTRGLSLPIKIEKIEDIKRNGHCFTDGVGKISPLLAGMIASAYRFTNSAAESNPGSNYPSVFQFRLGGGKGILAVEPSLVGNVVQVRPSQEKFNIPLKSFGLDICRISQFSAANLNMQVILVLSTLGVSDQTFTDKMRHMLIDLEFAMTSEEMALELLQRNVDHNQMTIQLASMILDGFMEVKDPFTITCLRLWRAWCIKYLKEKARIHVEQGAFVLGCIDETGILQGHFNDAPAANGLSKDVTSLPEIFLQIEDTRPNSKWRVVTGVCILARNPSLHPGDLRVVRAVDKPQLYHYKNCVVTPQTGDQDLPSMCSGGDLDGDDYLVMWDPDLIPEAWNHPAMDYSAPTPIKKVGQITVDDMTSFFVTHMKNANVGRIAVAHRYWADWEPDGVKSAKCLELAQLHSKAVDYTKTGIQAVFPRHLQIKKWPHWAEPKGKSSKQIYTSRKVLGQLYDMVKRVNFRPAWYLQFDRRILEAYELSDEILDAARQAKYEYDASVRRVMAKYSIKTEFEVWTTFVMEHSDDTGDYKFAETFGEESQLLKDNSQKRCYEMAGTNSKDRSQEKMGPFIAAMYSITAQEVEDALEECKRVKLVGGQQVPVREKNVETMPFMSFPWLFPRELGIIANRGALPKDFQAGPRPTTTQKLKQPTENLPGDVFIEPELPEVILSGIAEDDSLNLSPADTLTKHPSIPTDKHDTLDVSSPARLLPSANRSATSIDMEDLSAETNSESRSEISQSKLGDASTPDYLKSRDGVLQESRNPEDESGDVDLAERVTIKIERTALDDLEKLMEM